MSNIFLCVFIVEQRPWSKWRRTDESCVQHTGFDVEQVQQLYDMCEQSLINYYSHRNEQLTNSIKTTYLSPMNLLAVTLWYLKHYHSERYIATDLNLHQSSVNYFLSSVANILHDCIYSDLISLPVDGSFSKEIIFLLNLSIIFSVQ